MPYRTVHRNSKIELFPASFFPRAAHPLKVSAESRLPEATLEALRARGHDVVVPGPWAHGRVQAIALEASGFMAGAASPRKETAYVVGW